MSLKKIFICLMFPFLSLLSAGQERPGTVTGNLHAGFSAIDITPLRPVKLYGYSSRTAYSEGIHDPLTARAVVFENNGKKVVLVSCDLGSFENDVFSTVQKSITEKFGLDESELFLATIHSHSSPILSLDPAEGDPANIEYTKSLAEKLITVIGDAIKNLKPVSTAIGKGSSPVGANRREMKPDGSVTLGRNPDGVTDKEVLVMKVKTNDGKDLGAIFDYATHSTSLGWLNLKVSGDVLGLSAQFVEKILGGNVIAPVFAGASGNIDPWYRVLPGFNDEPGWIPEPVLLGTLLGEEVVHVFREKEEINPGGKIKTASATVMCPRRRDEGDNQGNGQIGSLSVPVNITVATIGDDVAFAAFNVEMLTEIGKQIKEASPFKYTFIITHCNGYSGYLAPPELYKEGGYEISTTPFEIGSSGMVAGKALKMLYDLK